MSGFQVGDVAVCVDDTNQGKCPAPVKAGSLYRVGAVVCGGEGIIPQGFSPGKLMGWRALRFRKLEAPRTEIADRIRACKPHNERVLT